MRSSVSAFIALLLAHTPLFAQSGAALQQIVEGWARGECDLLTHVGMDPETGKWQTVEDSPWATWTIRRAGPTSVEYTMSDGSVRLVEFADGVYRDRAPEDADEPSSESEKHIVEHGIHGPENWRILLSRPQPPDAPPAPRTYSEVIMAGDVFIWTNWIEDEGGVRQRTMYYACKFAGG